jgi:hypothetical protein
MRAALAANPYVCSIFAARCVRLPRPALRRHHNGGDAAGLGLVGHTQGLSTATEHVSAASWER